MPRELPKKTTFEQAADRCSFDLGYKRSERAFEGEGISAPSIDDAYHPDEKVNGEWIGGFYPHYDSDGKPIKQDWVALFLREAVTEAVHEALEWMQLDGLPVLDPHGQAEANIFKLCHEFGEKLYALSERAKRAKTC